MGITYIAVYVFTFWMINRFLSIYSLDKFPFLYWTFNYYNWILFVLNILQIFTQFAKRYIYMVYIMFSVLLSIWSFLFKRQHMFIIIKFKYPKRNSNSYIYVRTPSILKILNTQIYDILDNISLQRASRD